MQQQAFWTRLVLSRIWFYHSENGASAKRGTLRKKPWVFGCLVSHFQSSHASPWFHRLRVSWQPPNVVGTNRGRTFIPSYESPPVTSNMAGKKKNIWHSCFSIKKPLFLDDVPIKSSNPSSVQELFTGCPTRESSSKWGNEFPVDFHSVRDTVHIDRL